MSDDYPTQRRPQDPGDVPPQPGRQGQEGQQGQQGPRYQGGQVPGHGAPPQYGQGPPPPGQYGQGEPPPGQYGQGAPPPQYGGPAPASSAEQDTIDPMNQPPARTPVGHAGTRVEIAERRAWAISGFLALLAGIVLLVVGIIVLLASLSDSDSGGSGSGGGVAAGIVLIVIAVFLMTPLVVIQPGQTRVVQFFGRYVGTVRRTGLTWVLPLTTRRRVSIKVNNFETSVLKVNDSDGNPVDIAAIIVWQVADTAKAIFAVESYVNFVAVQSEAALRHVAGTHPYDDAGGSDTSLRGSTDIVSDQLAHEVASRVTIAGVEVVEVRISHLAYSQEIAQAMLQRQQASAIVAARERIVEGAVGMVEMALERLEDKSIVSLDEDRKAAMVSNLLVVLCGDQNATPVVNTGTLYN
jgi:regulator of protease activity HflC (stomatin/prohibitin superfamily)